MTTHNELLAEATQNYAMAHHYLSKLKVTLDQLSAVQSGLAQSIRPPVRCVREWQDWLAHNGPAIKADVHEGTGVKFTERGTPYTVEWTPSLSGEPDDRFAPNTLMKIGTRAVGRGAPAKVFFLWNQRFDVLPKFGVGPDRPDPGELGIVNLPDPPPDDGPTSTRLTTLEEWDAVNVTYFDGLVSADRKPTDDEKQLLRDMLPEGEDANAAIAIAYRKAVERSREPAPLLGVIQPPPLPDFTGHEVVGNHNHIPHMYGPLCAVSGCTPT